jgi:hypothetical protein
VVLVHNLNMILFWPSLGRCLCVRGVVEEHLADNDSMLVARTGQKVADRYLKKGYGHSPRALVRAEQLASGSYTGNQSSCPSPANAVDTDRAAAGKYHRTPFEQADYDSNIHLTACAGTYLLGASYPLDTVLVQALEALIVYDEAQAVSVALARCIRS